MTYSVGSLTDRYELKSKKQKEMALKIRINPPRQKGQDKNAPSSSTGILCSECSLSFSSTKALFGHLRIHRKRNRGAGKASLLRLRQAKHADLTAACILMELRGSKSETDIDDAKLIQLRWICDKIERERKNMTEVASNQSGDYQSMICGMVAPSMPALEGHNTGHCRTSNSNEEVNASAVMEMVAPSVLTAVRSTVVEMHQCDKCDKVFNSGQALGGHKRAHYTGPPLCRPGSNARSQAAAAEVRDFDLNEPAEEAFL